MTAPIELAPPARTGALEVDGRRVGWTEWGPLAGAPVLFCTGAAMTGTMGLPAGVPEALGARLICVDRAGLGRSAPDPHKSLASHARDVATVVAALGLERPRALGLSQGGPFAVALAATGAVRALALVAATDELAHPSMRPRVAPDLGGLLDAIAADPVGFEAAFAARADADGMWQRVLGMSSPHDRALYQQPAFAAAYRATLADGFAQGPAGYVRDLVLASQPWPTPPEAIDVPVALWYGGLDGSPVHSPDGGATLARRFPRAILHAHADQGGAILWTCARAILADLLSSG